MSDPARPPDDETPNHYVLGQTLVDRQPKEPEECAEVVLHLEGRCQCPVFAEPPTSGKE